MLKVNREQSKIIWKHREIMFDMDLDREISKKLHFWFWYIEGKRLSEHWRFILYKSFKNKFFRDFYVVFRNSLVDVLKKNEGYETLHNIEYFEKCRDEFLSDKRNLYKDPYGYFLGFHWIAWIVLIAFTWILIRAMFI